MLTLWKQKKEVRFCDELQIAKVRCIHELHRMSSKRECAGLPKNCAPGDCEWTMDLTIFLNGLIYIRSMVNVVLVDNCHLQSLAGSDTARALNFLVDTAQPQLFGNLGPGTLSLTSKRPDPVGDLFWIDAILKRLVLRCDLRIQELLSHHAVSGLAFQAIEGVHGETVTIRLVTNGKLEGRVDVSLLLVASNMEVLGTRSFVGQSVNEPGVRVEIEDDGLVGGKEGLPLAVRQTVRMVVAPDELEEIDDVDEADLQLRQVLSKESGGCQSLTSGDITTRGHDQIGLFIGEGARPLPDTDSFGAVNDGSFHIEVLQVVLLVCDDDVDVVSTCENVVHAREQAVAVRRQVDSDDFGGLVGDDVQKSGVLMGEAVVVSAGRDGKGREGEGHQSIKRFSMGSRRDLQTRDALHSLPPDRSGQ